AMHWLKQELDSYNHAAVKERADVEAGIWTRFGREQAVLVLDMSGFSRIARDRGIVFYLAMVRRMQLVTAPVVEDCDGQLVMFEADNLFGVFDQARAALACAVRINQALAADNRDHADPVAHIRVSIGIESGRILLMPGGLAGNAVNTASKL